MASNVRIDSVSPIANLQPLTDREPGRARLCGVSQFTSTTSKKRKRSEVAACVDGDKIHIYNVETAGEISKHAISPLIRFTSEPFSIYVQEPEGSTTRRTYVSVEDGLGQKSQVACWEHVQNGKDSKTERLSGTLSSTTPVVLIDAFKMASASAKHITYNTLAVYKDGIVQCLDDRLQETLWTTNLLSGLPEKRKKYNTKIIHAFVTDASSLKGILANTPEVLAFLSGYTNQDESRLAHFSVICAVTAGDSEIASDLIVSLIEPNPKAISRQDSMLRNLISWRLPDLPLESQTESLQWTFNPKANSLHASSSRSLVTIGFSRLGPVLSGAISMSFTSGTHTVLSASNLLASTRLGYTVIDTTFNTIQTQVPVTAPESPKKRKRGSDESVNVIKPVFVQYFPKLQIAVALENQDIVAIQLTGLALKSSNAGITKLSDSLGKGVAPAISNELLQIDGFKPQKSLPGCLTRAKKEELLELVDVKNANSFDQLFAAQVGQKINSVATTGEVEWQFSYRRHKASLLYREAAIFAIQCIFRREESQFPFRDPIFRIPNTPTLSIKFFPPNVFHWLIWSGQLTTTLIEQALRQLPESANFPTPIEKGDLIHAIASYDPYLRLLYQLISNHTNLDLPDLVHIIKIMVQNPDESEILTQELLTNGEDQDKVMDSVIDDELKAIDVAMMDLQDGIDERERAFHTALVKVNTYPLPRIVETFQETLSQDELMALIKILQAQLAGGGWTSVYVDNVPDEFENSINDVTIISRLMSCAIDAIGVNAWLAQMSGTQPESVEDFLASLTTEISATLEGVHEAQFMVNALESFLRYQFQVEKSGGTRRRPKPGTQIVVDDKPKVELPLGLKPLDKIELTRISGGEIRERSKRDIGRQISMKVPKYSFERIRP